MFLIVPVGTGDFNNDGQLDIVWRNSSGGANAVWFMNGVACISATLLDSVSDTNWEIVAVDYFSGITDRSVDIVWRF